MSIKIDDVVREIEQDNSNKIDYVTTLSNLHVDNKGGLYFRNSRDVASLDRSGLEQTPFDITEHAESQLLYQLGMPFKYFNKVKDVAPELYAEHFNYWTRQMDKPLRFRARRDGQVALIRGVVTPMYSPLDNDLILHFIHEALKGRTKNEFEVEQFRLTEEDFHLRMTYPGTEQIVDNFPNDLNTASSSDLVDRNRAGTDFVNSEVGGKSLSVGLLVWRMICSNGLYGLGRDEDSSFKQRHIHVDEAVVRDRMERVVKTHMDKGQEYMEVFNRLGELDIEYPYFVLTRLASRNPSIPNSSIETIKECWEGEYTARGIVNSFTRAGHEFGYEQRSHLESYAGELTLMPENRWRKLDTPMEDEEDI